MPLALLLMGAIPFAAGIARLVGLVGNPAINSEIARFVAAPFPVIVHILSVSLFSLFGALQLSAGLRQRLLQWHRVSGRIVVASGIFAALTGLWMTVMYPIPPELQGGLLYAVRVFVGVAMLLSFFLAVAAVKRGDIATHRAWMIRAFALGQGAGMQVVVLLPWMLLIGKPSMLQRDALMSLAWLINLLVAEMVIQRWSPRTSIYRETV
ncbi:MAG: DUF2306 domain-containing protein [Burkholderiaceae bacterium]|nr:DUF2306 domain-containing protein [Burkholderiaceae bacterium]